MYHELEGDIIELAKSGSYDVLIHGCNCQHTMGAGVAKLVAQAFPEALEADLQTPKTTAKLGTVSYGFSPLPNGEVLIIANAYTQAYYGKHHHAFNYGALRSCFEQIKHDLEGMHFLYPAIGAGLGLGNWYLIHPIIKEIFASENHTFVKLPKE